MNQESQADLVRRIKTLEWQNLELLSALEACQSHVKQCQAQILYLLVLKTARR